MEIFLIIFLFPSPAPEGRTDTLQLLYIPQMLAEYIQYKYIYSTDTCFPQPSDWRAHRHPPTAIYPRIVGRIYPIQVWHHLPMPMLPSSMTTQYNYFVIYIIVSHMFLNKSSFFWIWCKIVLGVKLSAVSNCPFLYVVSNCPVSNCPVSNRPVSNCPRCQIVRGVKLSGVKLSGVKLSAVSYCPQCQIVMT